MTLTERQKAHFEEWSSNSINRDPLYFFLVRGGVSYYVYCPDSAALCRDSNEYASYQQCNARYGAGRCKLYGVYGKVVWNFDKPADPNWHNTGSSPTVTAPDTRSITVNWEGRTEPLSGTMGYTRQAAGYEIKILIPGESYCDGRAEFTRKTWTLECRNGVSAGGSFEPLGTGKGSVGEGIDTNGRKITFRVNPAS